MLTRRLPRALAIGGMIVILACPRSITDSSYILTVTPQAATLSVGDSARFSPSLVDQHGAAVEAAFVWTVEDSAVAHVDTRGVVRAVGPGTTSVTVSAQGASATAELTVNSPPPPPPPPPDGVVLVGAGDIASCSTTADEATASLIDAINGTVFTAGDNAYDNGSPSDYANCYGPSWGRFKSRTRPAIGNHDYNTPSAAGYFGYYGAAGASNGNAYYSYDAGAWHVVVLDSNIGMTAGSTQETWLRADLAAHPARCTLAIWHHPRFSSGHHGSSTAVQPLWQALYDAGADLIVSGHDHIYERFAPQTPAGQVDNTRGIREFVVGTGGAGLYQFEHPAPNSEVKNNTTHGVLKLTLTATGYSWQFIPVAGSTFTDSGSASCH
ncbi:MAG TPA: metallophosphoesterase [Gemmatimonadales bacterium]